MTKLQVMSKHLQGGKGTYACARIRCRISDSMCSLLKSGSQSGGQPRSIINSRSFDPANAVAGNANAGFGTCRSNTPSA